MLVHETVTIVLLVLNVTLVGAFSACLLACGRLQQRAAYLVAAYLLSYADIVIVLELAGLVSAIGPGAVLALQLLLTMLALLFWIRSGRPSLLGPFAGLRLPRPGAQGRFRIAGHSPILTCLLILVAGSVAYMHARHAGLILVAPPNNYDSLTFHLSRVGYWLQYKSFYPWPSPFLPQTTLPMNGELGALWTILWRGTDQLAGFVQWTAVLAIVVSIYGLAGLLGCSRRQGALVSLLWPTLPLVMLQSSTTQNDLVSTSFCVAAIFLLLAGWREKGAPYAYLSGAAFGLAVGTKGTILLTLPGLACATLPILWLRRREHDVRVFVLRWIAACALGVFLLGSYVFAQNALAFGSPLGPLGSSRGPVDLGTVDLGAPDIGPRLFSLLRDNPARYIYQLVDFSPLPLGAGARINPLKANVFSWIFRLLHIHVENPGTVWNEPFSLQTLNTLNEDTSWFGPFGAVVLLAVVYHLLRSARHARTVGPILVLIAMGYFTVQSALQLWDPAIGRYYLIPMALCFPLMSAFLDDRTLPRSALAALLVLTALSVMFNLMLTNQRLREFRWGELLAPAREAPSWLGEFNYRMLSAHASPTASIGVAGSNVIRDYPFFGERFTHRVTRALPDDRSIVPRVDTARFAQEFERSDFLFIEGLQSRFSPDLAPPDHDLLSVYNATSIWIRKDLRSAGACDDREWPFPEFYQSSSLKACPRFPIIQGKLARGYSGTSVMRGGRFVPAIGPHTKFTFSLLVKEPTSATLAIRVAPRFLGPRIMQLMLSAQGAQPTVLSASFSSPQLLKFMVVLHPGVYQVQLGLTAGEEVSVERFLVTTP